MYEVLDVLSVYVFKKKADHKNGEHMIIFDLNEEENIKDVDQKEAIKKIQEVNLLLIYYFNFVISNFFFSYLITCLKI